MKALQTSVRGGVQDFLCPFTELKITQVENVGTHLGTKAIDVASATPGYRAPYYAPCDIKCVAIYPSSGQAMWQSLKPVRIADGRIGHVTFMTVHDDSFDAYVGMVREQGKQIGNMGMKGYATGVHVHFQASFGKDTSWFKNKHNIYMFNNEIYVDDLMFMDGTEIIDGRACKFKYTKDVPVASCGFKQSGAVRCIAKKVKVRTAPSLSKGDTGVRYEKGQKLYYENIVEADGYFWAEYYRSVGGKGYAALASTDGKEVNWEQI